MNTTGTSRHYPPTDTATAYAPNGDGSQPRPCPACGHDVLHTAQRGCQDCSCDVLVDWLGPVALKRRAR